MRCRISSSLSYSPGTSPIDSGPWGSYRTRTCSCSGSSVIAIDNKIELAMDLVKSHLMYAVREEVELLKEQIKELNQRNCVLEQENTVLQALASAQQLDSQLNQSSSVATAAAAP